MLTTWMLNQPAILGQATADGKPIATISDIGQTLVKQSITLDANASYDPNGNTLRYAWNFGDGSTATGITVNHTYKAVGAYTLTLSVSSPKGTRRISKTLNVVPQSTVYNNPYASFKADGSPPSNPAVILPTPNDNPIGQVIPTPTATSPSPSSGVNLVAIYILAASAIGIVIAFFVALLLIRRRKRA
jgi:PKD repeat protein